MAEIASLRGENQTIRDCYCEWSGQASNVAKSTRKRASAQLIAEIQEALDMEAEKEIGSYFGVPLTDPDSGILTNSEPENRVLRRSMAGKISIHDGSYHAH